MLSPDLVNHRAGELMRQGEWQVAIAWIEQIPEEAWTADLYWNHGWALFKLRNLDRAARSLACAVEKDQRSPVSHWALGIVLCDAGEWAAAEVHLKTALSLRDSGPTRFQLAFLYMEQGRLVEAEALHRDGLARRPDDREQVEAYADFLSDCGREAEAQVQYSRAATLPTKLPGSQ